ncbi:MAG: phage integrase N-terminal SAM-like domain-containing protein [Chloroflexota bacterium]|nr:phage integrase N-terminal SAM-like domain-containing protein [Chloroflexota bacterium]
MPERQASTSGDSSTSLAAHSSLRAAKSAFEVYMHHEGFTENTVKAFQSDLNILTDFIGGWTAIGEISTRDLTRFTEWLVDERDAPCSPKSLARRITTLKVFFGWLSEDEILPHDPAAPVVHKPVSTPLPDVLTDDQVERVLQVTEALRQAEDPDARPHLLVTLLLHTGIKKSECMSITMNHIDLDDPSQPLLWIRYANPQRRHKERKLRLPAWWPTVLAEYRAQYQIEETLFPCTARNLEYVLSHVAEQARLERGISFEMLRWTCAVRDYQAGMTSTKLRQKLGLSKVTWRQTSQKIAKLAGPPL